MSDYSPLCRACKIYNICHEPQKLVARACQHFEGELPNGFVNYRHTVVELIYKKGFAANIAYLNMPYGKEWLERWQVNKLIQSSTGSTNDD